MAPFGHPPRGGRGGRGEHEYTEGPIIGECRQCGRRWCISSNAEDGWRSECPGCGADGDYIMDPAGGLDG